MDDLTTEKYEYEILLKKLNRMRLVVSHELGEFGELKLGKPIMLSKKIRKFVFFSILFCVCAASIYIIDMHT